MRTVQTVTKDMTGDASPEAMNEVRLVGRVSAAPEERELPSGDRVVTFRVVVRRQRTPMTTGSRQSSDWMDCTAWGARARQTAARLQVGDHVEVVGALRRRFYRSADASGSRVEVEMVRGRRIRRAD